MMKKFLSMIIALCMLAACGIAAAEGEGQDPLTAGELEAWANGLKAVAQTAGIDKPLSSHWARHTGATLLLNNGNISMEVIRKILGHSSTRETEKVYAQVLDNTIADAMMAFDETL